MSKSKNYIPISKIDPVTDYEDLVLKLARKYNIPQNTPIIKTDTKFFVDCPSARDPLNESLYVELGWGSEDMYYSYQSYLYKQFEAALKIVDDFFCGRPIKDQYVNSDVYARVVVINIINKQIEEKKQNFLTEILPYAYQGLNLNQAPSKQCNVTNQDIINKFIEPTIKSSILNKDELTLLKPKFDITTELSENIVSVPTAEKPELTYEKLIKISKFIEENNHLINIKVNIAFGRIYFNKICGSSLTLDKFINMVLEVISMTNNIEIIGENLINLSKNIDISAEYTKQEQFLFSMQCSESKNKLETIDLAGNAERFIKEVFDPSGYS